MGLTELTEAPLTRQALFHMQNFWPAGKAFAFTIFDDPDGQLLRDGRRVYSFLEDLGFRTTKAVWPLGAIREPNSGGDTCADPVYLEEAQALQERGFEIGYHLTTVHSSSRDEIIRGLDAFKRYFGCDPASMANHYNEEAIYWGPARFSGRHRTFYNLATLGRNRNLYAGHVEGHRAFWGDICRRRIRYCRNFTFSGVDTLRACPWMPYHDPELPYVNAWFASSDGADRARFIKILGEADQDRLEEQGGACIMYSHFGHGFVENGRIDSRFQELMTRLSRKNGWFVPVSTLLDYLGGKRGDLEITAQQRARLELRWLRGKLFRGSS
ncbi:MAG TPA: hypothetical protein VG860_24225 [Terriglobia bacterium]|jgi:hypothetical protein|nr:hypothetical protein [Terriglobia bacterium]